MEETFPDDSGFDEAKVLDNALVMIVVLDTGGKVLGWNHAAERITGYPRDEVVGNTGVWRRLYPDPAYRRRITAQITGILSEKNSFENLETRILTRTGEMRTILWNTRETTIHGLSRVIAVGLDVTAERTADVFRRSIIENANVLITLLDDQGTVLVWNNAAERMTGYLQDEVVGFRDIWRKLYPDDEYRRTVTSRITEIIARNRYFENLETRIVTRTGGTKTISWNTRQIPGGSGFLAIAIGRDITDLKRAEEALSAYMLEIAMRIKEPVGIISENLAGITALVREGTVTTGEIVILLETQARNAAQVAQNVQEFQKAVAARETAIPLAYRKFLEGE